MAVARMRTSENVGELAEELGVTRRCLYKWRRKLDEVVPGEETARPSTHAASDRKQIHQLKRLLAEKTMEVAFFSNASIFGNVRRPVFPLVGWLDLPLSLRGVTAGISDTCLES